MGTPRTWAVTVLYAVAGALVLRAALSVVCYCYLLGPFADGLGDIVTFAAIEPPPYREFAIGCAVLFGLVPAGFGVLLSRGIGWARIGVTLFAVPGLAAGARSTVWPAPPIFDALAIVAANGLLVAVILVWLDALPRHRPAATTRP